MLHIPIALKPDYSSGMARLHRYAILCLVLFVWIF